MAPDSQTPPPPDPLAMLGQRIAALDGPPPPEEQGRFVIEAPGMDADSVAQAVMQALALEADSARRAGLRVEPLFQAGEATDPRFGLARYFLLTLPVGAPPGAALQAERFDIAYRLREGGRFSRVDPELPDSVVKPPPSEWLAPGEAVVTAEVAEPAASDPTWSLRSMRVDRAWALDPPPGGQRRGRGVRIGHPDTGWARHPAVDLNDIDLALARNILDDSPDAEDPLAPELEHLRYPGHGTSTGSVAVSLIPAEELPSSGEAGEAGGGLFQAVRGWLVGLWAAIRRLLGVPTGPPEALALAGAGLQPSGVAPDAGLVPIRFTDTVIITTGVNLARAIRYAAGQGLGVITMSLGGIPLPWVQAAIAQAVHEHDCIVVGAAGQPLPLVVAPAIYPECIAVAASNAADRPWKLSGRGPQVVVSTPGEDVWRATFERHAGMRPVFRPGSGTSFSAANLAGVAALWLAYHGRENLRSRYRGVAPLQEVFRTLLRQTARTPESWGAFERTHYGSGIVDAERLLLAPLPDPATFAGQVADWTPLSDYEVLRRMAEGLAPEGGAPDSVQAEQTLRAWLEAALQAEIDDVEGLAEAYGHELTRLFVAEVERQTIPPQARPPGAMMAVAPPGAPAAPLSQTLQATLRRGE